MFCSKCGKEIADNSKFCPECGKPISHKKSDNQSNESKTKETISDKEKFTINKLVNEIILLGANFIGFFNLKKESQERLNFIEFFNLKKKKTWEIWLFLILALLLLKIPYMASFSFLIFPIISFYILGLKGLIRKNIFIVISASLISLIYLPKASEFSGSTFMNGVLILLFLHFLAIGGKKDNPEGLIGLLKNNSDFIKWIKKWIKIWGVILIFGSIAVIGFIVYSFVLVDEIKIRDCMEKDNFNYFACETRIQMEKRNPNYIKLLLEDYDS